jgi:hypothetical protein
VVPQDKKATCGPKKREGNKTYPLNHKKTIAKNKDHQSNDDPMTWEAEEENFRLSNFKKFGIGALIVFLSIDGLATLISSILFPYSWGFWIHAFNGILLFFAGFAVIVAGFWVLIEIKKDNKQDLE